MSSPQPCPPPDTRLVKTRYNHTLRVDPKDYIGQKIIANGAYDHRSIDLLRPILAELSCHTILDVGANIGNHALAFSDMCVQLIAFEPGTRAYAMLTENVRQNDIRNITTVNAGLSDHCGIATLFVNEEGNLGGSTLIDGNKSSSSGAESVRLERGDAYLESSGAKKIDFIKIDVEGHEQSVLAGLQATIRAHRPLILMESDPGDQNHTWIADLPRRQALLPHYSLFALIWNSDRQYWAPKRLGWLRRHLIRIFSTKCRVLVPYTPETHSSKTTNLLLVPDEKRQQVQSHIF